MSIFHSTVSRRDFMKTLGLLGAGIGGAALVGPAFHDIDELMSAHANIYKRSWYVKERDFYNPTTECDWGVMKRRDTMVTGQTPEYYGGTSMAVLSSHFNEIRRKLAAPRGPGYSYKNEALRASSYYDAGSIYAYPSYVSSTWEGIDTVNANWKGPAFKGCQTPEERGDPKWTGTPEEAAQMLYAFLRFAGGGMVGFGELDQRTKTQILSTSQKHVQRPIVFEPVDSPYHTDKKYVLPDNKPFYYYSIFYPGSRERARGAPTATQQGAHMVTGDNLNIRSWNFLRYLGYQQIGSGSDNSVPFVEGPAAILTGVGESSRQNQYVLTPEYANMGRLHSWISDIPLAPTKPIDSGMFRFCHTCKKCANVCPSDAISKENEPSWDITPATINGKPNLTHNVGTKEFWSQGASCCTYSSENLGYYACFLCWGNCSFLVGTNSMIHEIVKGTAATTNLFNGFMWNMSNSFSYGADPQKAEDWWDMSLPILGVDTTRVAWDGGYRH